jgi:hypothetical protein
VHDEAIDRGDYFPATVYAYGTDTAISGAIGEYLGTVQFMGGSLVFHYFWDAAKFYNQR